MKIVIDARELRSSTGRYVERLLFYLQQLDHGNDYIVLLKSKDLAGWQPVNPRFSTLACDVKEFTFAEQFGYAAFLRSLHADVVHFSMPNQPLLYRGASVTTVHDLTMLRFRNPNRSGLNFLVKKMGFSFLIKRVVRRAKAVIVPTEFVRSDLAKYTKCDPERLIVTLEAADPISTKPEPFPQLAGQTFLLSVGNPQPHKNLRRLIDAFAVLAPSNPGLKLALVGKDDKTRAQIKRYVAEKQLSNLVVFTGFVSDGQLRWLYEHCAAYVMPSLSEGFSLTGLEAMAAGAPVVSSNATCMPEVYGDAAHYFDPYSISDMHRAMVEVLENSALRAALAAKGSKRVKQFSWERMARQTLSIYTAVKPVTGMPSRRS